MGHPIFDSKNPNNNNQILSYLLKRVNSLLKSSGGPSTPATLQEVTTAGNTTDKDIIISELNVSKTVQVYTPGVLEKAVSLVSTLGLLIRTGANTVTLKGNTITEDRIIQLPDEEGTVALQVTQTPYKVTDFNPAKYGELSKNTLSLVDFGGAGGLFLNPGQVQIVTSDLQTYNIVGALGASSSSLHTLIDVSGFTPSLNTTAPSSVTDFGVVGEIRVTATFAYFCTAPNTWRRVAIAAW